jgi:hypothetical protein
MVYEVRPLACRLFGFGNECPDVHLATGEPAATAFSDERRNAFAPALAGINERWTDAASGNTVPENDFMPIEFWLLLDEVGWDDQFDPNSDRFLGRSFTV